MRKEVEYFEMPTDDGLFIAMPMPKGNEKRYKCTAPPKPKAPPKPRGKITPELRESVIADRAADMPMKEMIKKYSLSDCSIYQILKHQTA